MVKQRMHGIDHGSRFVFLLRWATGVLIVLALTVLGVTYVGVAQQEEPLVVDLANADLTLQGEDNGDWTGYFASPAGDVNGDGLGDALIGAPMAGEKVCPYPLDPDGSCPGLPKGQGVAYLVLGRAGAAFPTGELNLANADASFIGCEVNTMTARQLYTAGDVNGDGYDDILISGWKCGPNYTGKTYLFLGRPDVDHWGRYFPVEQADASFLGENEMDFSSYYTAAASDVNADGYDDFMITSTHYDITGTAPITDAGKVYLILGRQAADWGTDYPLAQADASFLGEAEDDRLGRSVAGLGDVNGDGYGDFLIASISSDYGAPDAGQNYLFLGRAAPGAPGSDPARPWWGTDYAVAGADASFVGEAAGDESGRRVARAGDVNGDGLDDMLIGAALNDSADLDAGIAHLVLGRQAADWGMHYPLAQADASFVGEARRDQAGRRVSGAGDVNDDGYADFLIGAPHNSRSGFAAGSAYLIYGRPEPSWGRYYPLVQADVIYEGKPDVGVAGYDVAWLGDMNGDDVDDFLIAAYGGRNEDSVPGQAYVILGDDDPLPIGFMPDAPKRFLGWQRFTALYRDPNGWQDIQTAELMLGTSPTATARTHLRYEASTDALWLWDEGTQGWLGPCSPGDEQLISNGSIQLDCRGSVVDSRTPRVLRSEWRLRWQAPPPSEGDLSAYLRAVDSSGQDSGWVSFVWTSDLVVGQTVSPGSLVPAGAPLTYTLRFGNAGGSIATNVVITDVLPSELDSIGVQSTLLLTPTGDAPRSWHIGDLGPMQGGTITITAVVRPALSQGTTITNTASIAGDGIEDTRNNTAAVTTTVPMRVFLPVVAR
jgi:uncharacterized repeat protein (TIGR01451 family)